VKTALRIVPLLLLAGFASASADSLWSPDFRGYLSGGRGPAVGDVLVVEIDASSSLSFSSSSNDSKNLTLEFSGGETGNLFSFLPQLRTGGSQSAKGKEDLGLRTTIPVTVVAIGSDGRAQVQGARAVSVQGKEESVTVSGWASPKFVDQKGRISFSQLADARLLYRTFLQSSREVLTQKDLQEMLAPSPQASAGGPTTAVQATPAPAAAPAQPATAASGAAAPPSTTSQKTYAIPDARKKELLLLYLNRLIDVIFAQ
jgi:flagellar L-ring protein precursor FlgH